MWIVGLVAQPPHVTPRPSLVGNPCPLLPASGCEHLVHLRRSLVTPLVTILPRRLSAYFELDSDISPEPSPLTGIWLGIA